MTGENTTKKMRCPDCGSGGPFRIQARAEYLVRPGGASETPTGFWWEDHDGCECDACGARHVVSMFRGERVKDVDKVNDVKSTTQSIVLRISELLEKSAAESYIDSGEALEVLESARDRLARILAAGVLPTRKRITATDLPGLLRVLPRLRQRRDSVREQLRDAMPILSRCGMQGAAKWMRAALSNNSR